MSIVAVVGDCTTTTAVAMAAAWPAHEDVVVLEADRTGGSLAGWLDTPVTPSLSTVVANAHMLDNAASADWLVIDSMVRRSASGLRFIAAPIRARAASRAIGEASTTIVPLLASLAEPTVLADCGRHTTADSLPASVQLATSIVVIHQQDDASAPAASVRLERVAELVRDLAPLGVPIQLGVIGNRPFDLAEIHRFVIGEIENESLTVHPLADDTLSAAVFAGRTGVSAKRLARLPLMRSVRGMTDRVRHTLGLANSDDEARDATWLDQLGPSR